MIPTKRRPTHPGVLLKEMFLKPRDITLSALEEATGISRKHLSRIVNEHAPISVEIATKIAAVLNTTPELWVNAQRNIDIFDARQKLRGWKPKRVFEMKKQLTTSA